MCSVTEAQKRAIEGRIRTLEAEQTSNDALITDAERCIRENNEAIGQANCALDALGKMDLGGDIIARATRGCLTELNQRVDMCDDIIIDAKSKKLEIAAKITSEQEALAAVPENCGYCLECKPPENYGVF